MVQDFVHQQYPEQSALSATVAKTKLQRRTSKYSLLRFPRLPSQTSYFLRQVPCARNELTVNVHWTYIETLNMQWTRHRTLRKLRERANRWKSKENLIFVFFLKITINCTDLLLFAAFWTVFNVCSMLRSLYVHCMFNVSFHQKLNLTRDDTPVTLSDPTYPMLSRHTTYLDTPDWPGLFPSYLSLCAGAWSMVACSEWVCWMWMWPAGRKQKEMLFRDGTLSKVLSLQQLQRQSCKGGLQNTACYASHAFLHRLLILPRLLRQVPCARNELTVNVHWTYIEHAVNEA